MEPALCFEQVKPNSNRDVAISLRTAGGQGNGAGRRERPMRQGAILYRAGEAPIVCLQQLRGNSVFTLYRAERADSAGYKSSPRRRALRRPVRGRAHRDTPSVGQRKFDCAVPFPRASHVSRISSWPAPAITCVTLFRVAGSPAHSRKIRLAGCRQIASVRCGGLFSKRARRPTSSRRAGN
jgi:hypothetical protein